MKTEPEISVQEEKKVSSEGSPKYDVALIGGGLSGLALAIQLARKSYRVILFEKEQYPFHRVCGEYISLESWDFLNTLGVDLSAMQVPIIRKLELSAENGKLIRQELPLGGFGISRYLLDFTLAELARQAGVILKEQTRVNDVSSNGVGYTLNTSAGEFSSRYACCTFGKRSNLDLKWKRPFAEAAKNKLNNYIGVKYHVHYDAPADTIALHTFRQGYCGLVKVEGNKYNLCYLTTAANLQKSDNSIELLEQTVLSKNPNLASIFQNCKKEGAAVTISQISFDRKSLFEQDMLMGGDAAGMITPLCGNGMSMALHSSKIAFHQLDLLLRGRISFEIFQARYTRQWKKEFSSRLRMGRIVQKLSLNPGMMNLFIRTGKIFPAMIRQIIRKTHGKNF